MGKLATAVEVSRNAKLGTISTTYANIGSCPKSCPFMKGGACYAMLGPTAMNWRRLAEGAPLATAKAEAAAIDKLSGANPLRLHTAGDCATDKAAKVLASAASKYTAKWGQPVFTYTHAWRDVSRQNWGGISVLASCENPKDVALAREKGYATALVV